MTRLAILTSHPIQYYAPLFRALARHVDLHVFYAYSATPQQQAAAGFGVKFDWDVDLTSGYAHSFLRNVAKHPGPSHFSGCDTPEIGAELRNGRFDAVLAFGWHLKSLLQGAWAARRAGLPVLVRGDSQLATPRRAMVRLAKEFVYPPFLRLFDAALYVGERNRDYYLHYRFPENRLFRAAHCVDTEFFAARATAQAREALRGRLGIGADEKVLLFAGKLIARKRPLDLIEAAARLSGGPQNVRLLIAGSGELQAGMTARCRELGVTADFLGFRNQSEMPEAYAAADALVLTSGGSETWGLVCNEALACGRPVIVSDAAGCAGDLAGDGQAGRTFAMGDTAGLADAIRGVLCNPPHVSSILARSEAFSIAGTASDIAAAVNAVAKGERE